VARVYTDVAVFETGPHGVTLVETFGVTREELAQRLDVPLR
jgi:3-oxoadipate CoA-transferase beta subunit